MKQTIIPFNERPRERCLETGASCLSLRECLALILSSGPPGIGCLGLASRILERPGSGLDHGEEERAFFLGMEMSGPTHLNEIQGLGPAGIAKILAAIEIARRFAIYRNHLTPPSRSRPKVTHLAQLALKQIPRQQRSAPREWLGFIPFYADGRLGKFCLVERGVRTHVNTDPTELFSRILALRPLGFFLCHNHPLGTLIPSRPDLELTRQVGQVARQFGIQLLGHWIVTAEDEAWISPQRSEID